MRGRHRRHPATRRLLPLLLLLILAACGGSTPPVSDMPPPGTDWRGDVPVRVVSNGWHAGLVLARGDVDAARVPEAADFPAARWLEFGWGDRVYYPAEDPGIADALGAAFGPSPAVLHIAGLARPPDERYPQAEIVTLGLDAAAVRRLVAFVGASVERPAGQPRAAASGPGLYADSRFYPALGSFHLGNTCNTWTARGLAVAGLPVDPARVRTAGDLMHALRPLAADRS